MSAQVLKANSDIHAARQALHKRGLSHLGRCAWLLRRLQQRGWYQGVIVGDVIKSWDIYLAVQFIEEKLDRDSPILDIGAFQSEMPCILHRSGYTDLTGVDLNPRLTDMPFAQSIRYEVADFMHTPFAAESFQAITAISVIEHGLDKERLLHEVSRLLRPGGYFIASFDYWPDKQNTAEIEIFGMSWTIFSRSEVWSLVKTAQEFGLHPVGEIQLDAQEPVVDMFGKRYTFAWLGLQRSSVTQ